MKQITFFPPLYILTILALYGGAIYNFTTVMSYITASIYLNSAIITIGTFCIVVILVSLNNFRRSFSLLRLFADSSSRESPSPVVLAGTVFDNPIMMEIVARVEREGQLKVTRTEIDAILGSISDNILMQTSFPRFMSGVFILMGLFGTFIGLLQTIGGVGEAFGSLGGDVDISLFIQTLATPLQGMAVAFSSSLFGLTSSVLTNLGVYVVNSRIAQVEGEVGSWLESNISMFIPGIDPDSPLNVMAQVFDHVISRLENTIISKFTIVQDIADYLMRGESMLKDLIEVIAKMNVNEGLNESVRAVASAVDTQTLALSEMLQQNHNQQNSTLENFFSGINAFLNSLRITFNESLSAVSYGVNAVDQTLSSFSQAQRETLDTLARVGFESSKIVQEFNTLISDSSETLKSINKTTTMVSDSFSQASDSITKIANSTVDINRSIESAGRAFGDGITSLEDATRTSKEMQRDIIELFAEGVNNMVQSNDAVFQAQREILAVSNKNLEINSGIVDSINNVFEMSKLMEKTFSDNSILIDNVQKSTDSLTKLVDFSRQVFDKMEAVPANIYENIGKRNSEFLSAISEKFQKFSDDSERITSTVSKTTDSISSFPATYARLAEGFSSLTVNLENLSRSTASSNNQIASIASSFADVKTSLQSILAKSVDLEGVERAIANLNQRFIAKLDDVSRTRTSESSNLLQTLQALESARSDMTPVISSLSYISQQIQSIASNNVDLAPIEKSLASLGQQFQTLSSNSAGLSNIERYLNDLSQQLRSVSSNNVDLSSIERSLSDVSQQLRSVSSNNIDLSNIERSLNDLSQQLRSVSLNNMDLSSIERSLNDLSQQLRSIPSVNIDLSSIETSLSILTQNIKAILDKPFDSFEVSNAFDRSLAPVLTQLRNIANKDSSLDLQPVTEGLLNIYNKINSIANNGSALQGASGSIDIDFRSVFQELKDNNAQVLSVLNDITNNGFNSSEALYSMRNALNDANNTLSKIGDSMSGSNQSVVEMKNTVNETLENIRLIIRKISDDISVMQNKIKDR